ncbi:MAG: hypothetical protein Q9175_005649 [Cornicularia normoerica]
MASAIIASHTIIVFPVTLNCTAADRCDSFVDVLVGVGPEPPIEAIAAVINPDESAAPSPVIDANGIVLVPITIFELPRDMVVPVECDGGATLEYFGAGDGKTAGIGGECLVAAVFGAGVAKGNVDDPITSPPEARERVVLFSVMGGPEMERIVPFMEIAMLPRGIKVSLASVEEPDGPSLVPALEVASMKLELPMVRVADGVREYAVPLTVIAGDPGSSVLLPRIKPLLFGRAVKI